MKFTRYPCHPFLSLTFHDFFFSLCAAFSHRYDVKFDLREKNGNEKKGKFHFFPLPFGSFLVFFFNIFYLNHEIETDFLLLLRVIMCQTFLLFHFLTCRKNKVKVFVRRRREKWICASSWKLCVLQYFIKSCIFIFAERILF